MNTGRSCGGTRIVVAVLLLATLLAGGASAQTDEGRISGIVRDHSGAVVPGAAVTVRNEKTGDERTATSAAQGRYLVAGLKPSLYSVRVSLSGFKPEEFASQKVVAGQELTLDVQMKLATQSESITVSDELASIDKTSARQGANVNEREVTFLPINGRQLSQL